LDKLLRDGWLVAAVRGGAREGGCRETSCLRECLSQATGGEGGVYQKLNIQHNAQYSSNFIPGHHSGNERIALISILLMSLRSQNLSFCYDRRICKSLCFQGEKEWFNLLISPLFMIIREASYFIMRVGQAGLS
jgi:hypothetical protein